MNNLYEQKYKEALGWMQKLYDGLHGATKEDAEHYFPELKENEDEKIRKQILSFLKEFECDHYRNLDFSSWIAWLEKQGEQKTNTDVPTREVILSIWDLGNEWKEITNGCISTEYGTQLNYIQKHWHESEYYSKEKQGEQILANSAKTCKIELKFKAGDWVVHKFGFVWHVDSFDKKNYQVSNGEGDDCYFKISKQDEFHLWTIDDAKDGDVLVCDSKYGQQIGIVKRYVGKFGGCDMCFKTYCFVDWEGNFLVGEHIGSRDIHPATKEQRVLLFQKMKEAGYEWDYIDNKLLYLD